ncbi:MAG: rcc01693 family protein [Devosia sp.]
MTPFPWSAAMQFGFGVMRLSSRDFWGLTPRELASAFEALSGHGRAAAPGRDVLTSLMAAFPDKEKTSG